MEEKPEVIYIEVTPAFKQRILDYLNSPKSEYKTITDFGRVALREKLDKVTVKD